MTQSKLEADFALAWHIYAPNRERPVEQYRFAWESHRRRWQFDFCWPDAMLAVEIDGGQWKAHGGRHNTDGDREKLNAAAALGWRVMRFSASMLRDDPEGVVRMVSSALTNS